MSGAPAKYARVLSIDGGGIRGIIPAAILVALEAKLQRATGNPQARIADFFDLVSGTSTGGIMTCTILATDRASGRPKFSAQDILDIYYNEGAKIFGEVFWHEISSAHGLTSPKYSTNNIESIIQQRVADTTLSELAKPCVIVSWDLQNSQPVFFKSHEALRDPKKDYTLVDVALSTSAAPTYFKPRLATNRAGEKIAYIDGGVCCNNPALIGLVELTKMHGITQREAVVLSLGTGTTTKGYSYNDAKDWGPISWVQPLLNTIMIGGVSNVVHTELLEIYSGPAQSQYLRIQPQLESTGANSEMDDASQQNRDALRRVGQDCAKQFDAQLDAIVQLLLATK